MNFQMLKKKWKSGITVEKMIKLKMSKGIKAVTTGKFRDGTPGVSLSFKSLKEKKKLENEAKKLNLSPEGYVKIVMLGNLSRKEIMKIADEYSLKN